MEAIPNVHKVTLGSVNAYLVVGELAAFIDSGHDDDDETHALLDLWKRSGWPNIEAIVATHRHADHAGGVYKLSQATKSVIISTRTEKIYVEEHVLGTKVDRIVGHGDTLDLGGATLEFVHTPGHTLGSMSVYYREEKVLFAGDTIRTNEPFHLDGDPSVGDMALHLKSLTKLLSYDIRIIAPGHGPYVDDGHTYIEKELANLQSEYSL